MTVKKTEKEKDEESQESDKIEEVTVAADKYKVQRLIGVARQTKIPP